MRALQTIHVMKTGFSLYSISHRENLFTLQGSQLMKTGFSQCGNTTQGKPCSDPVLALYGIAVSTRVITGHVIYNPADT